MTEHRSVPPVALDDRVRIAGTMANDPDPLPIGAEGTVDWVNTWTSPLSEQIGAAWDNGRSLLLLPTDPFEVIGLREEPPTCFGSC